MADDALGRRLPLRAGVEGNLSDVSMSKYLRLRLDDILPPLKCKLGHLRRRRARRRRDRSAGLVRLIAWSPRRGGGCPKAAVSG